MDSYIIVIRLVFQQELCFISTIFWDCLLYGLKQSINVFILDIMISLLPIRFDCHSEMTQFRRGGCNGVYIYFWLSWSYCGKQWCTWRKTLAYGSRDHAKLQFSINSPRNQIFLQRVFGSHTQYIAVIFHR